MKPTTGDVLVRGEFGWHYVGLTYQLLGFVVTTVAALAASGCSISIAVDEPTGRTSQAITGGTNDTLDTVHTNVVVGLDDGVGRCSGTLLTPTVVLTAGHCYYGFQTTGQPLPPAVLFGPNGTLSIATDGHPSVLATNPSADTIPVSDIPKDLAIYYIDFASLNQVTQRTGYAGSRWQALLETVRGARASLTRPATNPNGTLALNPAAAGYAPTHSIRQTISFDSASVHYDSSGIWKTNPVLQGGDSGGALFWVRADGTREVFGVDSLTEQDGFVPVSSDFVDITTASASSWIRSQIVDHSHDHQPGWLAMHPGYLWRGEVEYYGPCRTDDQDCDHWTDEHDNCPLVINPDQTATGTDDTIGDACAPCPCDRQNDVDGDGFCGPCDSTISGRCAAYCSSNPPLQDNCPTAYNPGQENCNAEAEQAARARFPDVPILGDLCDPVPCPQFSADTTTSQTGSQCCPNPGGQGQQCYFRKTHDAFAIAPIAAHPLNNSVPKGGVPLTFGGPPTTINNEAALPASEGATEARYCQSDLTRLFNCHATTAVTPTQLNAWPTRTSEQGDDTTRPWHRITLGPATTVVSTGGFSIGANGLAPAVQRTTSTCGVPGDGFSTAYSSSAQLTKNWCFQEDWSFWTSPSTPLVPVESFPSCQLAPAGGGAAASCQNLITAGTCLGGTMWMHADSTLGYQTDTEPSSGLFVGLHTGEQQISDHYIDITPDPSISYCPTGQGIALQGVSTAPAVNVRPVVLWPFRGQQRGFDVRETPVTEFLIPSLYGGIAALQDDGNAIALGNNGSPCAGTSASNTLVARFGSPLVWANAVEPSGLVGTIDRSILALGVSADGRSITDAAVDSGGHISAGSEYEIAGSLGIGVSHDVGPPARQLFVPVFSRAAGGLYVVGGTDAATGGVLHDIWFMPLGGDWSHLVYGNYTPGRILAATYSFGDKKLWVLDAYTDSNHLNWIRLARLARTSGGVASILGAWPDLGLYGRWFLTVDRDGGVLLAGSNALASSTVRFSTLTEPPLPTGLLLGTGGLAYRPIVDPYSYAFLRWSASQTLGIARSAQFTTFGLADGCQFVSTISLGDLAQIF